jgi:activator of HSP90 ATPase
MVLHNPNNWHWVNKDASVWTKQWLEENLVGLKTEDGGVSAQVDKVVSMDGDVDVNQRKGKVITIFDVKLVLEYSGTFSHNYFLKPSTDISVGRNAEKEEVSGTITVPEVAHDTEENEYVVCLIVPQWASK